MEPWVVTYKDAKSLVICGDIHGEFVPLVYEMCVRYGMRDTLVIVAGDCGFGFEKPGAYDQVFRRIEKRLAQNNCWIAMVRGNHDDPAYFATDAAGHTVVEHLQRDRHPLERWYYGHFHNSWHSEIDGVWYKMLDIMELLEVPRIIKE